MKNLGTLVVALAFTFGCSSGESAKPAQTKPSAPDSTSNTTGSTSLFSKRQIKIAGQTISVEVADTDPKRAQGLMFRTSMPENEGMLFVFESEQPLSFWMRNTKIPLAIAYIDAKKTIVDIKEMVPALDSDPYPKTYPSAKFAMYALEMNKGWFARNKVKVGQKIEL